MTIISSPGLRMVWQKTLIDEFAPFVIMMFLLKSNWALNFG